MFRGFTLNISNALRIRYVKMTFKLVFPEDSVLPTHKVSALRGGIGEMLLRQNCVRDRDCDACDFESECIVRRTMYSKYEIQPAFSTGKDSMGYVIECENYKSEFPEGSALFFNLILFGKTIVYLNQYLMAVYALGQSGIAKNKVRFFVDSVMNERRQPIMEDGNVYKQNYKIETIQDYVNFRKKILKGNSFSVRVQSPTSITYRKEALKELNAQAILESAARKIYMLDCYEGIDAEMMQFRQEDIPIDTGQESIPETVRRYSSTANSKMNLRGIRGHIDLENVSDDVLSILIAAELTHIGKNTSFGFGRIKVKEPETAE